MKKSEWKAKAWQWRDYADGLTSAITETLVLLKVPQPWVWLDLPKYVKERLELPLKDKLDQTLHRLTRAHPHDETHNPLSKPFPAHLGNPQPHKQANEEREREALERDFREQLEAAQAKLEELEKTSEELTAESAGQHQALTDLTEKYERAVDLEREACAKLVDERIAELEKVRVSRKVKAISRSVARQVQVSELRNLATLIRGRGQ